MLKMWKVAAVLLAAAPLLVACGSSRPGYSPESMPPEIAFDGAPPTYVSSPQVTLSVTAASPKGVKGVYALCGSQRWSATKQESGTWQVEVTLPVTGTNTVIIWAEDLTSPAPNSGQGMNAPYQLTQDIVFNPTPPSITYDATYGSYSDERSLTLEVDANGVAKMPAAYSIGPRLAIPLGGHIYKASTRLSGGAMTATELETTNSNNVPVLRFVVPLNGGAAASVNLPTFTVHTTCASACGTPPDASGTLLRAATTSAGVALFELPLTTETVPALAQVQGAATLSFTLTVTDAAGNSSTAPGFNFLFHVIGPPVAIAEDTQYPGTRAPNSTYAYSLSDGTYARMWDPTWWTTNQGGDANVRLARLILTNPFTTPVALKLGYVQASGGSWRAVETWQWSTSAVGTSVSVDGFSLHNPLLVRPTVVAVGSCSGDTSMACATGYAHAVGDVSTGLVCLDTVPAAVRSAPTSDSGAFSSSDVAIASYRIAPELGNQERSPNTDASRTWTLVPAAQGGVPGTLVVYLLRPVTATRSRPVGTGWVYTLWKDSGHSQICKPSGYDSQAILLKRFDAVNIDGSMSGALDGLYGAITGSTHPFGDLGLFGETSERVNIEFDRSSLASH